MTSIDQMFTLIQQTVGSDNYPGRTYPLTVIGGILSKHNSTSIFVEILVQSYYGTKHATEAETKDSNAERRLLVRRLPPPASTHLSWTTSKTLLLAKTSSLISNLLKFSLSSMIRSTINRTPLLAQSPHKNSTVTPHRRSTASRRRRGSWSNSAQRRQQNTCVRGCDQC